jgi:ribosomal protein S13
MPINYNTQTFADILEDVNAQVEAGLLTSDNADEFFRGKHNITLDEYENAAQEAAKAEKKYYEIKEEFEDSPLSFMGLSSTFIPAHLQEQELSTFQSILDYPPKAVQALATSAIKGAGQLAEMVLPDPWITALGIGTDKAEEILSSNKYTKPLVDAFKQTMDPKLTTSQKVVGEIGGLMLGGIGATRQMVKYIPDIRRGIASTVGFTGADLLIGDKDYNTVNAVIALFPEAEGVLDFAAIHPDDNDAQKILKKAIDGLVANGVIEAGALGVRGLIKLYKKIKGRNEAVNEEGILDLPTDTTGRIRGVEAKKVREGEFQHRVVIDQPIKIMTDVKPAKKITENKLLGLPRTWLTHDQGFDRLTRNALEKKEGAIKQSETLAQQKGKELTRVLEKEFGLKFKDIPEEVLDQVSTALGNVPRIEHGASEKILKILNKSPKKRTKAEKTTLNKRQAQLIRSALKQQETAATELPLKVQEKIADVGGIIDEYSKKLIDKFGLPKSTRVQLDRQLGLYVKTDYEVFSNPSWVKALKAATKGKMGDAEATLVIQNYKNFLKSQNPRLTDPDIDAKVIEFINKFDAGEEAFFTKFTPGTKAGNISSSEGKILTNKQILAEEERALLKEVRDPVQRFISTATKQGKVLAEGQFLKDIETIADSAYGKNLYYASKAKKLKDVAGKVTDDGIELTENLADVADAYLRAMGPNANPLAKIFTTKTYKKKLMEGLEPDTAQGRFFKVMHGAQGFASGAKTILSQATHVINIKGNFIFTGLNGNFIPHFKPVKYLKGDKTPTADTLADSLRATIEASPNLNRLIKVEGSNIDINIDAFRELQQFGLIDNSISAEFFLRSLKDAYKEPKNILLKKLDAGYKALGNVYRGEDAVFKMFNFFEEMKRYRQAFPDMPEQELKVYAAEVVKNTHPIYSRVPRLLKATRAVPVVGAFPSFLVESVRAAKGTIMTGVKDTIKGMTTGNMALVKAGATRLAATTAGVVTYFGYQWQNELKHGITSNDNMVLEQNSPAYETGSIRNYQNSFHMNKKGEIETTYVNESRINPYDAVSKGMQLAYKFMFSPGVKNQKDFDDLGEQIGLILQPIITPSLVMKPLLNALTGRKNDRELYEEGENMFSSAGVKELLSIFDPQTRADLEKLYNSWRSEQNSKNPGKNKWGYPDRFEDRLRRFAGISQTTFNFNRSLQSKVSRFSRSIQAVQNNFNSFLKTTQEGRDWQNPDVQEEFFNDVDKYLSRSYNAQQNLADHLYDSKKLTYYEDKVRKKVDDQLLLNILSDKGMKKIDKNFNYAVVFNAVKNGVGFFKPPSIGDTLRNQLINRFNVPSEIVIELETKLAKLAGSAIPLLEIKEKSEEE